MTFRIVRTAASFSECGSGRTGTRLGSRRALRRVRRLAVLCAVSIGALGLVATPAAATTTMQDLGTLGGTYSFGTAVSGDIVVGYAYTAGNAAHRAFAFDL